MCVARKWPATAHGRKWEIQNLDGMIRLSLSFTLSPKKEYQNEDGEPLGMTTKKSPLPSSWKESHWRN